MESGIGKKAFKAIFITIFMTGIVMVLGLINQSIVGKTFGPIGVGVYATSLMVIRFLVIITLFGLPVAFSRWVARAEELNELGMIKKNYAILMALSTVNTLAVIVILQITKKPINSLIGVNWGTIEYLIIGIAVMFYGYARLSQSLYEGILEPLKSSLINISLLGSMFIALIISMNFREIDIFYIVIIGFVSMGIIGLALVFKDSMLSFKNDGNDFKEIFIFSSPVTFVIFLSFIGQWADRLILNNSLGLREVGVYTAALSIFEAGRKVPMSLGPVLMPVFSKLNTKNTKQLEIGFNKMFNFNFVFLLFITSLIFVNAEYLIYLIYSEEFHEAVLVLKILAIQMPLSAFSMSSSALINGINKPKLNSYISINGVLIQVVLIFGLTIYFGLIGTAIAQVISTILNLLFIFWIFKKYVQMKIFYSKLIKSTIWIISITLFFIFLQDVSSVISSPIFLTLQAIFTSLIIWFFILESFEKNQLKRFLIK